MKIIRGQRVNIVEAAVPVDAVNDRHHTRENALVIFGNLYDSKVGIHHKVMFNAGNHGVIFKSVLDTDILGQ